MGKIFLHPVEYERIVRYLSENEMQGDLDEWKSRCELKDGYYLYDQKNACQFLDKNNLCRMHFTGVKPSECFWWPLHVFWNQEEGYTLKAGTYCCDGCKFVTPDSKHAEMVESQAKHLGLDLIKKFRMSYPGRTDCRTIKTINPNPSTQVVGTKDFENTRDSFRNLGGQHFPSDLLYSVDNVSFLRSPSHFFAGLIRDDKLVSCSDMVLVSVKEFSDFKDGNLIEDKLYGGDLWTSEAYLYINALILDEEHHIPYLYRQLFKDVQTFCSDHEVRPTHCFALSTNPKVHDLLVKAKFKEVGSYQNKYPIMLLNRKDNAMLHTMMPTWEFDNNKLH